MSTTTAEPCVDCLGRDVFEGEGPDASSPSPELRTPPPGALGTFFRAHRRSVLSGLTVLAVGSFVLLVLPQVAGFGDTIHRLGMGDKTWLAIGLALEALSIGGYVAAFRAAFSCHGVRIGWGASYQITLAGLIATKLFAAAGAGGVALTAWALRASGLSGRTVARRIASFEIILYAIYMGALVVFGVGLATGVLHGGSGPGMTVIPAAFGALVIALALVFRFATGDVERRMQRLAGRSERARRLLGGLATVPATFRDGMITAAATLRDPHPGLLGVLAYWGFDIATLWAAFHAFGAPPPVGVLVMGYFVGTLANVIPIPGGVGGVEGGMIGSFLAFGVDGSLAVVAVLAYRAISFWLPMLPGAHAYLQLRRTVSRWRGAEEPVGEPSLAGASA